MCDRPTPRVTPTAAPARLGTALLALLALAAPSLAQDAPVPGSKFYPLAVGSKWEYDITAGEKKQGVVAEITGTKEIDGVRCVELRSRVNDQDSGVEHLRGDQDGVRRYAFAGMSIKPPVLFLKEGAKAGDKWDAMVDISGQQLSFTYEVIALDEAVKVPAGEYKAMVIKTRFKATPDQQKETEVTFYYAPEVGPVKNLITVGDDMVTIELTKYTAGPAK